MKKNHHCSSVWVPAVSASDLPQFVDVHGCYSMRNQCSFFGIQCSTTLLVCTVCVSCLVDYLCSLTRLLIMSYFLFTCTVRVKKFYPPPPSCGTYCKRIFPATENFKTFARLRQPFSEFLHFTRILAFCFTYLYWAHFEQMPFGLCTRVGTMNHVLDGGRPVRRGPFWDHVSNTPWAMDVSSLCAHQTQYIAYSRGRRCGLVLALL